MELAEYFVFFDSPYPSKRGDLYGTVQVGPRIIEWDSWICELRFNYQRKDRKLVVT